MDIRKEQIGPYVVYHLSGDLDHLAIDFALAEIAEPGDRRIVLDINGVDRIDSTGYGGLIKLWKGVTYHGGELHLLCSNSRILQKLEELNIHKILHIFRDNGPLASHQDGKWNSATGIKVSNIGNFKIVSFEDSIPSLAEVRLFKEDLLRQVNGGMIFLALDFSSVKSVTSDFIGALLAIRRLIDLKDGWFVFIGVHNELFGIFDTVGLTKMFSHYPDLKAFEAALKGKDIIS
jgi:anti-anti-sigma factor